MTVPSRPVPKVETDLDLYVTLRPGPHGVPGRSRTQYPTQRIRTWR
jgi:hypothetical protein